MAWLRHGVVAGLIVAFAGTAGATSTGWSDNFNGGIPQQDWHTVGSGFSTYMNDRLYMQAEEAGIDLFQARYVNEIYTDIVMRANVQMYTGYPYLAYLLVRGDALTMSGYVLGVSSPGAGGVPHLWIGKLTGGVYSELASQDTQTGDWDWTDCQVEFDVTGNMLSGKVWSTGSSDSWQIQTTDSSYAGGVGGLMVAAYPALGWNQVWAAFDDVNLVATAVPEPVTMAGLMLGIGGLVTYVRKRRMAA